MLESFLIETWSFSVTSRVCVRVKTNLSYQLLYHIWMTWFCSIFLSVLRHDHSSPLLHWSLSSHCVIRQLNVLDKIHIKWHHQQIQTFSPMKMLWIFSISKLSLTFDPIASGSGDCIVSKSKTSIGHFLFAT